VTAVKIAIHHQRHDVDVWGFSSTTVDLHFDPRYSIPQAFRHQNSTIYKVLVDDNEVSFGCKKRKGKRCGPSPLPTTGPWNLTSLTTSYHDKYHPLEEINSFLQQLADEHSDLVELIKLGRSSEGRDILAVNIAKPGRRKHRKMRMVVQGAQHAREVSEWLVCTTAQLILCYIVDCLLHCALFCPFFGHRTP
jgi:hypothetical protein